MLSLVLTSCGGKRDAEKENSLTIISAGISDINSVLPGGLMIFAHEASQDKSYAYHAYNGHTTLELDNGNWTFWAVGWKGGSNMVGPVRCAKTSMNLEGGDGRLVLLMNDSRCDDVDFAAAAYRASSQFKALKLVTCNSLAGVSAGTSNCSGTSGPALSYKIKFPQLDGPDASAYGNGSNGLEKCVAASGAGTGITTTSLLLPTGGSGVATSFLTTVVEVHNDGTCTDLNDTYVFPNGITSTVTSLDSSNVKIFDDVSETALFLKPEAVAAGSGPTVTLSTAVSSPHNSTPYIVSASFSENVNGVGLGDFTVVSGTASNLIVYSSSSYTVDITPSGQAAVQVTYASGSATAVSDGDPNQVSNTLNHTFDSLVPQVSEVYSDVGNGTYGIGATLDIIARFSEIVVVSGTPEMTLETGTSDEVVSYIGGTGSDSLTFRYTVAAGNNSSDLDYQATNSLALNGGTIRDSAGNNANLTLATPNAANSISDDKAIIIDGVVPTVTEVDSTKANNTYTAGELIDIRVKFSEPVNVSGTPSITLDFASDYAVNYSSGTGSETLTFQYTVQAGQDSSDLDYAATNSLSAGTSIRDTTGNNANRTLASPGAVNSISDNQQIVIDNTAPSVVTINRGSTPGANPTNATSVEFDVTFSEAVGSVVAGDFSVTNSGTGAPSVSGVAGGPSVWTVTVDTTSVDGNIGLDLADGNNTIQDTVGIAVSPNTHTSDQTWTVDSIAPTVSQVRSTKANGDYNAGEVIDILIEMSENVTVGGTPQITLDFAADYAVNYASGSGSNTLTFRYTVQAGQDSTDLDYAATNSFALNGGTVLDSQSNAAVRTLATPGAANSIADNQAIVIDTTTPTATSVTMASDNAFNTAYAKVGDTTTLSFTLSEGVTTTPTVTIDGNGATVSGGPTVWTADYVMQSGDNEGSLAFTLDFTDDAGNAGTQVTAVTGGSAVIFDETPPTAITVGHANGYYGLTFNTSLTASTDNLAFKEYRYRLDGTVPTDCGNGTGTTGASVGIPVLASNNTSQDFRAIACDEAGNASTSVSRTYTWLEPNHLKFYTNTSNWNDWINNSTPGTRGAALCPGSGDCIHGAQYLEVDVPELSSCTGLSAMDVNDVFIWECDDTGNVKFTNHRGFKDGKGLGDLLDPTAWKSLHVDISGASLLSTVRTSPNTTTWGNTVSALPASATNGTMQTLTAAGTLYTYNTSTNIAAAYNITANNIGIVNVGGDGTKLEINTTATTNHCDAANAVGASNSKCMVVAKNRSYVWVEGEFDGRNTQLAVHMIYYHTTIYSTIHNSKIYDSGETGINFNNADKNFVSDVEVYEHEVGGSASIYLQGGSSDNKFYKWDAYEGNVGLWITGSSANNNFKSFRVAHHQDTGIYVDASHGNKFQDGIVTGTDDTASAGIGFHTFSGTQDTIVVGLVSFNNFLNVNFDNGSGNILMNATLANGSDGADGGLLIDNPSLDNSLLRIISVNQAGSGIKHSYGGGNRNNAHYDISLADNPDGFNITSGGAHQNPFQGILDFENNTTDCNVSGGTKGINSACSDTTGGSNVFTYDTSSGLSATSFVGKGATPGYATLNGTDGWINGLNFYQAYGQDGAGFGTRGPCETGETCALYDWALATGDGVAKGLFSAPSGTNSASDNITHTFVTGGAQSILRYAVEVNPLDYHTFSGDQDGICENGEVCVINPNMGAYQGHGNLVDTPTDITTGTPFNNIKLLQWDTNGY